MLRLRLSYVAASLVVGFAALMMVLALYQPDSSYAQNPAGLELQKQLLKESNVVRVGETLTFAITITNNWNTTVLTLPMIDVYDASIMRFLDATPAANTHIAATGVISWNNVLETTGPLAPGQQIVVLVRFIAEHPTPRVVNRAYTHDAYDSQNQKVGDGQNEEINEAIGGRTPLTKTLALNGTPAAGTLVTFTLRIYNDGAAEVNTLPLRDIFDQTALQYVSSVPPIDGEAPGIVVWSNVLRPPLPSDLAPGEAITVTVVFTALRQLVQTVNRAETFGANDAFGNDLAPAADDVPIQIVAGPGSPATATPTALPTATATPRPTRVPQPRTEVPTASVPTNIPAFTATPTMQPDAPTSAPDAGGIAPDAGGGIAPVVPTATLTPSQPISLPETGQPESQLTLVVLLALWLAAMGWQQRRRSAP